MIVNKTAMYRLQKTKRTTHKFITEVKICMGQI